MFKKYCVFALILLMFSTANIRTTFAISQTENQTSSAEKTKRTVAKAGVGEKARVTVTLRDGAKLSGYINEARDNDFTLTDKKTKNPVTVLYADAVKIKRNKLSTAAKVGISIGIGVAAYVIVVGVITKGFQETGN